MFYIKEIVYRFQYFLLSFFVSIFFCYYYKNILILLISCSLINSYTTFYGLFDRFIYNHPIELIKIQMLVGFTISLFCLLPYILWLIFDFIKSSLIKEEYKKLKIIFIFCIFLFLFINTFCFFILFPNIWFFFQELNNIEQNHQSIQLFFELRVQDYYYFLLDFLYLINLFIIIGFFLFIFIYFHGINNFITWKKLFIFINILFATFLSPPDVYSQLLLFFVLMIILEIIVLFYIYTFKLKKYVINRASY